MISSKRRPTIFLLVRLIFTAVAATLSCFGQAATSKGIQPAPPQSDVVAQEIESVERDIDAAIDRRDGTILQDKLADSFTLIHTLGPIESRDVFIQRVVAGTALARQRTSDWAEFDVNLSNFEGHTAIRRSRIRFRFAQEKRETWLLQLRVFVKQRNNWRLASWNGTMLHEGPVVDATTYQKLAGEYLSDSGPPLVLSWHGGGILARWPGIGVVTQIFPISEAEFEDRIRRLRFTFDSDGRPTRVVQMLGTEEVWQGRRSK